MTRHGAPAPARVNSRSRSAASPSARSPGSPSAETRAPQPCRSAVAQPAEGSSPGEDLRRPPSPSPTGDAEAALGALALAPAARSACVVLKLVESAQRANSLRGERRASSHRRARRRGASRIPLLEYSKRSPAGTRRRSGDERRTPRWRWSFRRVAAGEGHQQVYRRPPRCAEVRMVTVACTPAARARTAHVRHLGRTPVDREHATAAA